MSCAEFTYDKGCVLLLKNPEVRADLPPVPAVSRVPASAAGGPLTAAPHASSGFTSEPGRKAQSPHTETGTDYLAEIKDFYL